MYHLFVSCNCLGEGSSEKICCWLMTFRQPERNGQASESSETEVMCQSMLFLVWSIETAVLPSLISNSLYVYV